MTVEIVFEQFFAVSLRFLFGRLAHTGRRPALFTRLDDPGRHAFLVTIGVHPPPAMLVLREDKGEVIERLGRRQPAELVGAPVHRGLELVLVGLANQRCDAVPGDHEVMLVDVELLDIRYIGIEAKIDAELLAAVVKRVQQLQSRHATEAVALRVDSLAVDLVVDATPVSELFDDSLIALRIGIHEALERLIGKYDTESPGRIPVAAFDHGDVVRRVLLLHEDGKIERCRSTA